MNPQILIACIQINLLKCPLMRAQTVQDCLNKSRNEVNAMIESGALPFAFDLAPTNSKRKEPRVFTLCVAESTGWKNPAGQTKNFHLPEVIGMILPKRDVRSSELKRIFACSRDLIGDLAENFSVARKPVVNDGPNCFTVFHRESVATFLEKRRIM
jgi:hypothetical protein